MKKANRMLSVFIILSLFVGISGTSLAGEAEKININTASEKELTQLDGIGTAKAAAIVKYREENGLFGTPEDLMKVKGIGEKIFGANKDRIAIGHPDKEVSGETQAPEKDKASEKSDQKVSEETKASEESEQKVSEETKTSEKEKVSKEKKSSEGKESSEEE